MCQVTNNGSQHACASSHLSIIVSWLPFIGYCLKWSSSHTTRGRDGREEGGECGY